jgi:ankyrin repeat protein
MIMNKVKDINPRDNEGWTPLHAAAVEGQKEMCKFIADKVEDTNPEDDESFTPQELL